MQDNTLHTLCVITQRVSNHYTVEDQFFAFNLEKKLHRAENFTQTQSVVSVTNIRYERPVLLQIFNKCCPTGDCERESVFWIFVAVFPLFWRYTPI